MPPQTIQPETSHSQTYQPASAHQAGQFMEHLIRFLLPFFLSFTSTDEEARAEILATLASYGPRTRQEYLHAAQIIAFGLSALDALAEAKAAEMSPALRLRYRGCANSLNRACQQNEKALARLRACDVPAAPEPRDDLSEDHLQEALLQAKARIDATRNRLSNARTPAKGGTLFTAVAAAPPGRPVAA
jgi:hypothetical protein